MKNWLRFITISVLFIGVVCGSIYFVPRSPDARMNVMIAGSGGGAASELCDGSADFCVGWETGTGVLNTGASGNEGVFDSSNGDPSKISYDWEGDSGISTYSDYLVADTSGETRYAIVGFEVDSEAVNTGGNATIMRIYNDTSYRELMSFRLVEDSENYDSNMLCEGYGHFDGTNLTTFGTQQTIVLDTKYTILLWYSSSDSSSIAGWTLYNESGTQIYTSGNQTVTTPLDVTEVRVGSGNATVKYDGFRHDTSTLSPY